MLNNFVPYTYYQQTKPLYIVACFLLVNYYPLNNYVQQANTTQLKKQTVIDR